MNSENFRPLLGGVTYLYDDLLGMKRCFEIFVPFSGVLLIYPVLGIPCKYWAPIADCGACHNLQ